MSITFDVGDYAVYPGHGVGRITSIEIKEIMGTHLKFYAIEIMEGGMKILVPSNNVSNVGVRPLISRKEAGEVLTLLEQPASGKIDNQTWNRRYREYMEKIKTGSVYEIAAVLRDLFLLKVDKELSFGERKMLDTARGLLIKELALATQDEEEKIEEKVRSIFGM